MTFRNKFCNADITDEEIIKAVKSLKMGKSAGLDGVISKRFFHSLPCILSLIARFFNRLFKTADFPESWGDLISYHFIRKVR